MGSRFEGVAYTTVTPENDTLKLQEKICDNEFCRKVRITKDNKVAIDIYPGIDSPDYHSGDKLVGTETGYLKDNIIHITSKRKAYPSLDNIEGHSVVYDNN